MFIFLRTPSLGLKSASYTPQELLNSFGEKLVFLKMTRGTCVLTALGISQEPSELCNPHTVAPGQKMSLMQARFWQLQKRSLPQTT